MNSPESSQLRNFARRVDLTSLHLFVAVVETGSIDKAAEREFIAPSAVSKRLSDLEATLGTALLYRHARGVDLSPAGETFLHHARSVLFSLEYDHVRLHSNSSIYLAMCRMIHNGLGLGLIPDRAFALMRGVGDLVAIELNDAWAARDIHLVARDFATLPVTTRMLVEHLTRDTQARVLLNS